MEGGKRRQVCVIEWGEPPDYECLSRPYIRAETMSLVVPLAFSKFLATCPSIRLNMDGEKGDPGLPFLTYDEQWLESSEAQWLSRLDFLGDHFLEAGIKLFSELRKRRKKQMEDCSREDGPAVELAAEKLRGLILNMAEGQAPGLTGGLSWWREYLKSLPVCKGTHMLNLSGCHSEDIPILENSPPLKILYPRDNNLWLNNNHLSSLPAEIGQLRRFKELRLDHNELTSIPAEISSLGKLEVLWLNNNRLSSLPAEISQLSRLKELRLDHNKLTSIPAEISSLGKLELLDVRKNPLLTLPTVKNARLRRYAPGLHSGLIALTTGAVIVDAYSLLYRPKYLLAFRDEKFLIFFTSKAHREFEELWEDAKNARVSSAGGLVIDYYNKHISKKLTMEEAALQMLACSLVYLDEKFSTYNGDIEFNVTEGVCRESVRCYAKKYRIKDSTCHEEGCVAFHLVPQGNEAGQKAHIILFRGTNPDARFAPKGIQADMNRHAVGLTVFNSVQKDLQKWMENALRRDVGDGIKLVITGHSLGGALAMHTFASIEEPLHRQKNVRVVTFNAPGVDEDTIRNKMCGGGVDVNLMKGNICMVRHEWDIVHYAGMLQPPGTVLYTGDLVDKPLSSLEALAKSKVPVLEHLCNYVLRSCGLTASPPPLQDLMEAVFYAHTVPAFALRQMHGHRPVVSKRVEHNEGHWPDDLGKVAEYVRFFREKIGSILKGLLPK